mmetsp:Transcript_54468/g.162771  ORF Transcript_54468/g.162771 Transcript_54468/m.162771 type:complete len:111 (-) Transcript_54468:163-495(-)|eukprot:CAMPEP_0113526496 /NCGR_PEP_ID=MMETSP0015_2-20120614/774_1 /TAXON_ID=2838 /ORGANISM="Odontella" /LENGTH=110 /DNA_ID=CAMNT_0000424829 /DNA_START=201 /DNA_END=533 /DNA_ORIENTATION=+ /assembly_acc=CAM_ASM_000160
MSYVMDKTQTEAILAGRPSSGVLCNDPSGLCLGFRGSVDSSESGTYTSIARLAAQLDGSNGGVDVPLVSVETDKAATLIKEYDGHAVVLRTPVTVKERKEEIADTEATSE